MSSSKVVGFMKDVFIYSVHVAMLVVSSIVIIRGFIVTTSVLYPDMMTLINKGYGSSYQLQFTMAFKIFIQLAFSLLLYSYAHRAYKRLKDFTWGQR